MKVTAVVMAGGKGTRMALPGEKPLLPVCGKPVVDYVIDALRNSKRVDSVVVAVSDYTPKTAAHLAKFPVKILKTPGKEYVSDMGFAVKSLKLQIVLTIAADMPLITSGIIDDIIDHYFMSGKPALAVAVPMETKKKFGMSLGFAFEHGGKIVVPAGINVNDGKRIDDDELEQEVYIVDKAEVAININTVEEMKIAEKQFAKTSKKSSVVL